MLDDADRIWNRACDPGFEPRRRQPGVGRRGSGVDIFDLTDEEADLLHALGRRYFELLPDDERLVGIFRQHRAAHPGLYEPVEA